jgi:colicin import membrane protein
MTLRDQLAKKAKKGRLRALSIALVFHGMLAAFLFVGIRWNTQTPQPIQIEVFTPPTVVVEKPVETPIPEVKPEPEVKPKPEIKPEAKVEKPKTVDLPPPDLATEKKKAEKKRRELEKEEAEADRLAKIKSDKKQADKELAEKDKARKETEKVEAEKREAKQQERIKQLQQQAGAQAGAAEGAKTGVTDADYVGRLIAVISRNTVFSAGEVDGNPIASFVVDLNPDCSIRSVRLTKSSRASAWDQAAERAIRKTDPFPKPSGGNCPARMDVTHRPQQ